MQSRFYFCLLILLAFKMATYSQEAQKNILFLGNSITYYNDMPVLFENIANNKGKNVITEMYAPGGTGFVNHVEDDNVYDLFSNTIWDAVVLQPGSGESIGYSSSVNATIQRGKILMDSIRKYSPCAKILLYEISNGVASSTTYDNYYTTQGKIKDSITKMADSLHIPFVPAGESARMHYTAQQDLLLHGSYGDIHPNLNGSYLIAATMFAAIFQEPVTGTTSYGGVPQVTAEYFHGIADQVVLPNKPQWRINTYNLHADFNYAIEANTVSFFNTAANFESLEWDFGDGTLATDENPTHAFTSDGIKTIKLKATQNGCDEVMEKQINLESLGISNVEKNSLLIYPNPSNSNLNIFNPSNTGIRIINAIGQEIYTDNNKKIDRKIDVSTFANGVYLIVFDDNSVFKFIKG